MLRRNIVVTIILIETEREQKEPSDLKQHTIVDVEWLMLNADGEFTKSRC
ncbi:MAG: hypothetical protein AB1600_10045 [Bacteroidota bacterium]